MFVRDALLVAGKDLRIERRSRVALQQILPFGGIVIVMFAFALDADRTALPSAAPGLFWAAVLLAALLAIGRSFSVDILRLVMGPSPARTVGPAIASMLIYLLMALVLYIRPTGLFPAKGR